MVWVVGLGSKYPEFKSHSSVEVKPGGAGSTCHPSEVGKMSAIMLVYCVGVATVQDCVQQPRRLLRQQCSAQSLVPMEEWMDMSREMVLASCLRFMVDFC